MYVETIADLYSIPCPPSNHEIIVGGYYEVNDQGGGTFIWHPTTSPPSGNGGTIFPVSSLGWFERIIYTDWVSVKWFGAKGDFDPSTGIGNDDRPSIQSTFNYVTSSEEGGTIVFPNGRYYLGEDESDYGHDVQLILGSTDYTSNNIKIEGNFAEIYPGRPGKALLIYECTETTIADLKIIGYTGGTLGSSRENDALVCIVNNSKNILLTRLYLTNCLGDCIYIGGDISVDGAGLGYTSENIQIMNCVLKERFGNGTKSLDGGTMSREAIALIDGDGIEITNNTIYGSIDLEPNLTGQYIANVRITANTFLQGNVIPQEEIGTQYWFDEPTSLAPGMDTEMLNNDIKLNGVAGGPIIENVVCISNSIENGMVLGSRVYEWDLIVANVFNKGAIYFNGNNNEGYVKKTKVLDNTAYDVYGENDSFIVIQCQVALCLFQNNTLLKDGSFYCIGIGTPPSEPSWPPFDLGNNIFINNRALYGSSGNYYGPIHADSVLSNDFQGSRHIVGSQIISDRIAVGDNLRDYDSFKITRNGGIGFSFVNDATTTGSVAQLVSGSASSNSWLLLDGYSSSGNVFRVYGSGDVVNTNNSYGSISDIKLKENIRPVRNYLSDLMKVNVVEYSLKTEKRNTANYIGVIAQELEKIFPEMVQSIKDGNPNDPQIDSYSKSVKYSDFVPMLVKSLQELHHELQQLKREMGVSGSGKG